MQKWSSPVILAAEGRGILTKQQLEEFGAYLRGLRQQAGLSLRQVQKEIGISPGYLALVENAERNPPQPEFLRKLAALYKVSPVEILRHAGYLEADEAEEVDDEQTELQWAYDAVRRDPTYRSGQSLSGEATPDVMRFVVELYEHYTGKKLLGRRRARTEPQEDA